MNWFKKKYLHRLWFKRYYEAWSRAIDNEWLHPDEGKPFRYYVGLELKELKRKGEVI